ncbi:hypothetical protein BC628DRAFT_1340267 [Trametes gibbosa]|nr:hypothetical protein BC628DRAFT_1340267 [Trametes gibbosa]
MEVDIAPQDTQGKKTKRARAESGSTVTPSRKKAKPTVSSTKPKETHGVAAPIQPKVTVSNQGPPKGQHKHVLPTIEVDNPVSDQEEEVRVMSQRKQSQSVKLIRTTTSVTKRATLKNGTTLISQMISRGHGMKAVLFKKVVQKLSQPQSHDAITERCSFADSLSLHEPSSQADDSKKSCYVLKLADEMLKISVGKALPGCTLLVSARSVSPAHDNTSVNSDPDDDSIQPWLPHTNITEALTWPSLNTSVKNVLHASFEHGKRIIAMGDGTVHTDIKATESIPTPFGLHDNLGYNGQHDIADRLERGSEEHYIAPMRYCGNKFQYAQPFSGPSLVNVIRAAFFGNTKPYQIGFQHLDGFTSSLTSAPHQVEILVQMLAIAATAVNAVLLDHIQSLVGATSKTNKFAGTALENTFRSYMNILVKLRVSSIQKYHALLHKICMSATGGRTVNLHGSATQNDILVNVDWLAITSDDS